MGENGGREAEFAPTTAQGIPMVEFRIEHLTGPTLEQIRRTGPAGQMMLW